MFYEAVPTNTWYNPLYNNGAAGTGSFIYSIAGTATPGSASLRSRTARRTFLISCITLQNIYALTPKFKNEYTWNVNVQVAQQLAKNDSLTLGYIMTNGRNMQFLRNSNLINPTGVLADGRPVFNSTRECCDTALSTVQQHHTDRYGIELLLQRADLDL